MHPIAPSAKKLKDLALDDSLKKSDDGTLFLLEDEDPEDEDQKRIICYATKENIKQLWASTTWLCDGTFGTCPSFSINSGWSMARRNQVSSHTPISSYLVCQVGLLLTSLGRRARRGKSLIQKTCNSKLRLRVSLQDFALKVVKVPFGPNNYVYEKSRLKLGLEERLK